MQCTLRLAIGSSLNLLSSCLAFRCRLQLTQNLFVTIFSNFVSSIFVAPHGEGDHDPAQQSDLEVGRRVED